MKKFLICAALAALVAGSAAVSHAQNRVNALPLTELSQVQQALQWLQTTKTILNHTPEDPVGHRSRALTHVNAAIYELRLLKAGH